MSIVVLLDERGKRGIASALDIRTEFVTPMPVSSPRSHRHQRKEMPPLLQQRAPSEKPAPAVPDLPGRHSHPPAHAHGIAHSMPETPHTRERETLTSPAGSYSGPWQRSGGRRARASSTEQPRAPSSTCLPSARRPASKMWGFPTLPAAPGGVPCGPRHAARLGDLLLWGQAPGSPKLSLPQLLLLPGIVRVSDRGQVAKNPPGTLVGEHPWVWCVSVPRGVVLGGSSVLGAAAAT